MVNIRRGGVEWYGLRISAGPADGKGKPFYLTGEDVQFRLTVKNPSKERRRSGTLVIVWHFMPPMFVIRPIKIDVPPGKVMHYDIPKEWLCIPGMAIYELLLLPTEPEETDATTLTLNTSNIWQYTMHTLCSYAVKDKGTYEYEEKKHKQLLEAIRGKKS